MFKWIDFTTLRSFAGTGAGYDAHRPTGVRSDPSVPAIQASSTREALDLTVDVDDASSLRRRVTDEQVLGVARFLTALVLALAIEAGTGTEHPPVARLLIVVYAAYSLGLLAVLRARPRALVAHTNSIQILDLVWATLITAISGGVSSHAFPLFMFVLGAAASRWGLRRALIDGAIVVTVAVSESILAVDGLTSWPFELDWFLVWLPSSMALAVLFGIVFERVHLWSAQAVAIGRVTRQVGQAAGLTPAMRASLREALRLLGCARGLLVVEDADRHRVSVWRAELHAGGIVSVSPDKAPHPAREIGLFPVPRLVSTFEVRRRGPDGDPHVLLALDQHGIVVKERFAVPAILAGPWTWQSIAVVIVDSGRGFVGRLFLLDPKKPASRALRLEFLYSLARQVAPLLLDLYYLRGLRARVESGERARLARELHDGIVQSLAGVEMRIEAIRRCAEPMAPSVADELVTVRDLLHDEVLNAREMMQRLRASECDARQLPHQLRELVERFSRESCVDTQLDWAVEALDLRPRHCLEVLNIVREALVNVRRHSRASRAVVRIEADAGGWSLIVEDAGRGMPFTGTRTHDDLEAGAIGPRVIRERVAAMGGRLTIESSGGGTRLEMAFSGAREM